MPGPTLGGHLYAVAAHAQVKEVSLGAGTSHTVLVGAVLAGSVGVTEPHRKLTNPGSRKGCRGSVLKVVTERKLVEGPTMEVSSTGCCVSGTYQRRRGVLGMHVPVLNPKMSLISAWCSQPHQDGSRQGHGQYTGCSFISACPSTSITVS